MKKIALIFGFVISGTILFAQKDVVMEVWDKYAGREGVSTVYMSSYMFRMFASVETDSEDFNELTSSIESIRIITVEDQALNEKLNFYKEIMSKLRKEDYEQLMVVSEPGQQMEFLVKEEKRGRVSEFLMVSGGSGSNTLISIRGNINLKNIANLSKTLDIEGLEELEQLEEKKK